MKKQHKWKRWWLRCFQEFRLRVWRMKKQHKESGGGCTAFKNTGSDCGSRRTSIRGVGVAALLSRIPAQSVAHEETNNMNGSGVAALFSRIPSLFFLLCFQEFHLRLWRMKKYSEGSMSHSGAR
jgi:hypothetical protein